MIITMLSIQEGPTGLLAGNPRGTAAVTITKNENSCIPLGEILEEGDTILLLTPVVALGYHNADGKDPFEILGRGLAARHPGVQHVPYTARNGITDIHRTFIQTAQVVIFVISGPPAFGQPNQIDLAREMHQNAREDAAKIIIACQNAGQICREFSTVVTLSELAREVLIETAKALFETQHQENNSTLGSRHSPDTAAPSSWQLESWKPNSSDLLPVVNLWNECLPKQFHLSSQSFRSILANDDSTLHFVVRQRGAAGALIGFCATYIEYMDRSDRLIGSIAALIVHPHFRNKGIGLSLHNHTLRYLKQKQGMTQVHLGSTFPRLFRGVPTHFASITWFSRRGWDLGSHQPTNLQVTKDLVLKVKDWPSGVPQNNPESDIVFRQAEYEDLPRLQNFVADEPGIQARIGCAEQYNHLMADCRVEDIIVGIQQSKVVGTALVYTTGNGSTVAMNLPWAQTIGDDVGGITCVCITDNEDLSQNRDTIMIRLLDTCVVVLKERGMQRVFLDDARSGYDAYQALGFQEWCTYREAWHIVS